jgi:outer membrane protein assembly factor BamB
MLCSALVVFGMPSPAAAKPAGTTVSSFAVSPSSLGSQGGEVDLTAHVTDATSCAFSADKPVNGLPVTTSCSNGTVDDPWIVVPTNSGKASITYRFHLAVTGTKTVGASVDLTVAPTGGGPADPLNWSAYLFGATHSSENAAATAITTANASSLGSLWNFTPPGNLGDVIFSTPTVYNGGVYIGSQNGTFYDLNETNGAVVWSHYTTQQPQTTCTGTDTGGQGFASSATVAPDPNSGQTTVYVAAPDGYLYAWNASTGARDWRSVVGIPSKKVNDYFNWSSPTVANGMVYVGVASSCDNPLVQGGEKVYDQATGALLATFDTTPPNDIGGSIWSSALVSGGSVYVTTGNPNFTGGAPGYSYSIVRLDPQTLQPEDYWTIPADEQPFDSDFGGSPTSWTADISGVPTQLVGASNKNGDYYALNASDLAAGPVWQYQIGNYLGGGETLAAAVWDQTNNELFLSANYTGINGTDYNGSVRSVNPGTGAPIWQAGLPGEVMGTPTLDGAGVLAVPTMNYSNSAIGAVYLLNELNGQILGTISTNDDPVFGQPVFADNDLFVGTVGGGLTVYQPHSG